MHHFAVITRSRRRRGDPEKITNHTSLDWMATPFRARHDGGFCARQSESLRSSGSRPRMTSKHEANLDLTYFINLLIRITHKKHNNPPNKECDHNG